MAAIKSEPKKPKVDVRNAAHAAADYFKQLFPGVTNFSLEEVELSEDELYWWITLGFDTPVKTATWAKNLEDILGQTRTKYKMFKVDARTGNVLAMKIRKIG